MHTYSTILWTFILVCQMLARVNAQDDPRLTSWYTADSGRYASIYPTVEAEKARTPSTTWSRRAGEQRLPTYAGVSEVAYSQSWVYLRTTGLASYVMGPWYLDAARNHLFPNLPSNTATIYRIPRLPVVAVEKVLTRPGAIGYFVNGVAFFDNRDTFSYSNANGFDASPVAGIGRGDGVWERDAYVNEGLTFDSSGAHQARNQYHYHVQPIALRSQLGDHVDYDRATNTYHESTAAVTKHSPILAWAADGYPIYGPYGYSTALDAGSGLRRMVSGYVPRNGSNGTTDLSRTGRRSLPAWAAEALHRPAVIPPNQYGPNVGPLCPLGHYLEDYDWLGDLGGTAGPTTFDLDRYNGRHCVTPEYPKGTYAYFTTIDAHGVPMFPYTIGRQFYGTPTGGAVASIGEAVTIQFKGGPSLEPTVNANVTGDSVTLRWSAAEGGTYTVQSSSDGAAWTPLSPTVAASSGAASLTQPGPASNHYRARVASLAEFDSAGFDYPGAAPASVPRPPPPRPPFLR